MSVKPGETFLPLDVVAPIVKRMIEERHYDEKGGVPWGGTRALEAETGVNEKRLYDITKRRQNHVSYTLVDTLLTKTGNFLLWYEEPLRMYFDETNTLKSLPRKAFVWGHKTCCKGCGVELSKRKNKYCLPCYRGLRKKEHAEKTRCACGAKMQPTSQQCRACFYAGRKPATKVNQKWASGESWQIT